MSRGERLRRGDQPGGLRLCRTSTEHVGRLHLHALPDLSSICIEPRLRSSRGRRGTCRRLRTGAYIEARLSPGSRNRLEGAALAVLSVRAARQCRASRNRRERSAGVGGQIAGRAHRRHPCPARPAREQPRHHGCTCSARRGRPPPSSSAARCTRPPRGRCDQRGQRRAAPGRAAASTRADVDEDDLHRGAVGPVARRHLAHALKMIFSRPGRSPSAAASVLM